jgi:NAD(P)-dependent dehydrogenase (short-subunit alcohol dehydrogenase family)
MRLKNKVALITGASSGIGKESALLFAKEGAKIVAVDLNDTEGEKTVAEIKSAGGEAVYTHADISKAADCNHWVETAENQFGKLDVMFNNAGIMDSRDGNALVTEEDVWDLTMAINLKGVFLGCKYGIAAMQRAGGGSIINTASFVGLMGAAIPYLQPRNTPFKLIAIVKSQTSSSVTSALPSRLSMIPALLNITSSFPN